MCSFQGLRKERSPGSEWTPAVTLMLGVCCGDRTIGAEATQVPLVISAPFIQFWSRLCPQGQPWNHSKSFCTI